MKKLILGLLVLSSLYSCSIEKRHYMKGFYVTKHDLSRNKKCENGSLVKDSVSSVEKFTCEVISASRSDIQEIKSSRIGFVQFTKHETPSFDNAPKTPAKIIIDDLSENIVPHKKTEKEKTDQTLKAPAGAKSQIVALLLCLFLGYLGIHRFYLGYTGMGLLYLFTGGLLGIGWLIDFILLIIPGGLTPKGKDEY